MLYMNKESSRKERNASVELLRILAMLMIIIMHCMAWSGALYDQSEHLGHFYWLIEALCVPSVDVFVLISGYYLVTSRFKARNLVKILGTVWSYAFLCSLLNSVLIGETITAFALLKMMFPILTKQYWFVNAYLALYILSPFLNKLIHSLEKKQFAFLLVFLLIILVIRPTLLPKRWAQDQSAGLSVFFFVVLYFLAAWIRLYFNRDGKQPFVFVVEYLILSVLLAVSRIFILTLGINHETAIRYYSYDSAFVVLQSLALFLAFLKKVQISGRPALIISRISKCSFAAYIIHYPFNRSIWSRIPIYLFLPNPLTGFLSIVFAGTAVFFLCVAIELVRQHFIEKIRLSDRICILLNRWDNLVNT